MPTKNEIAVRAEGLTAEVRAWLRELRRHHGSGDLMKLDAAMGKKRGYCANLLRDPTPDEIARGVRRRLGVEEMFQVLLALGLDPHKALRGLFGFDLDLYLRRLERQKKHQVRSLRQRLARTRPLAADLAELARLADELEGLRLSRPKRGKSQAFRILASLANVEDSDEKARVECETWGGLAGLQRMTGTFSAGAHCLRNGLELARGRDFAVTRARLLRRCCYLASDQGDYEFALQCAEEAQLEFAHGLDPDGLSRTFLDIAIMLRRMNRHALAIRAYEASLELLPETAVLERTSAYQSLGIACIELGEVARAESCLTAMKSLLEEPLQDRVLAAVRILEGEIALRKADYAQAAESYREVREIFSRGSNTVDLAIHSVRLAKSLFLAGELKELNRLAFEMLSLPARCRSDKLTAAAINDFLRAVANGTISIQLIDRVYLEMMRGTSKTKAPQTSKPRLKDERRG